MMMMMKWLYWTRAAHSQPMTPVMSIIWSTEHVLDIASLHVQRHKLTRITYQYQLQRLLLALAGLTSWCHVIANLQCMNVLFWRSFSRLKFERVAAALIHQLIIHKYCSLSSHKSWSHWSARPNHTYCYCICNNCLLHASWCIHTGTLLSWVYRTEAHATKDIANRYKTKTRKWLTSVSCFNVKCQIEFVERIDA